MKSILLKLCMLILSLSSSHLYAASFFNVNYDGFALTVSTTINHNYPLAGIRINNVSDLQITDPTTQCSSFSNGFCITPLGPQANTFPLTGNGTNLNVTLCLNGLGPITCQNFQTGIAASAPRFAFVTEGDTTAGQGNIYLCTLGANGILNTCQSALDAAGLALLGDGGPQGIAFSHDGTMVYMTNGTSDPVFYQCQVGANNLLSNCRATTITTTPPVYNNNYGMIALHPTKPIAYIGDEAGTGRVLACPIVNNIIQGNCTNALPNDLGTFPGGGLSGISLNRAGTIVYVSSWSPASVTVCNVSANGMSFTGCVIATGVDVAPFTFGQVGDTELNRTETLIYITEWQNGFVYVCDPTITITQPGTPPQGNFTNCRTAATITNAWGMMLNKTGTIAYVTNDGNSVYSCPILANNLFGGCVPKTGFSTAADVTLRY